MGQPLSAGVVSRFLFLCKGYITLSEHAPQVLLVPKVPHATFPPNEHSGEPDVYMSCSPGPPTYRPPAFRHFLGQGQPGQEHPREQRSHGHGFGPRRRRPYQARVPGYRRGCWQGRRGGDGGRRPLARATPLVASCPLTVTGTAATCQPFCSVAVHVPLPLHCTDVPAGSPRLSETVTVPPEGSWPVALSRPFTRHQPLVPQASHSTSRVSTGGGGGVGVGS